MGDLIVYYYRYMSCGPELIDDFNNFTVEDMQRIIDGGIENFLHPPEEERPTSTNTTLIGNRAYRREMVGKYFKK